MGLNFEYYKKETVVQKEFFIHNIHETIILQNITCKVIDEIFQFLIDEYNSLDKCEKVKVSIKLPFNKSPNWLRNKNATTNSQLIMIDAFNVYYHLLKIMKKRKIMKKKCQVLSHLSTNIIRMELIIHPLEMVLINLKEIIQTLH